VRISGITRNCHEEVKVSTRCFQAPFGVTLSLGLRNLALRLSFWRWESNVKSSSLCFVGIAETMFFRRLYVFVPASEVQPQVKSGGCSDVSY
jgi:hypothetical protein